MNNRPVPELQTDPEFDELIQSREEKYLEELEENIFDHGCLEPVCVWNGIILDGRLRYKICTKWDILIPQTAVKYDTVPYTYRHYGIQAYILRTTTATVSTVH